jgi:hypothetical protein
LDIAIYRAQDPSILPFLQSPENKLYPNGFDKSDPTTACSERTVRMLTALDKCLRSKYQDHYISIITVKTIAAE